MNDNETYVRINRSILHSDLWLTRDKKSIREAFLDILLSVNNEPNPVFINGKRFKCGAFQSLNSVSTWASRWNCDKWATYRYLKRLKKLGYIRTENMKYTIRITVLDAHRFIYLGSDSYKESGNGCATVKSEKTHPIIDLKQDSCSDVCNGKKKVCAPKQVEDSMYKGEILKESSLNEIEKEKIIADFFYEEKKVFEKEKKQVSQGELFKPGMSTADYERRMEIIKKNIKI